MEAEDSASIDGVRTHAGAQSVASGPVLVRISDTHAVYPGPSRTQRLNSVAQYALQLLWLCASIDGVRTHPEAQCSLSGPVLVRISETQVV